ncbi:uncharacterized protein BX663DRAFT_491352 [Cokeromyces recurvatus]|uniref:uncharacterized protein n=1 Tax=Cokeromyces recurvatus TaxID=90255 RepID=UPI00221F6A4B|nr:uncharacterized protein BX663DRAFT_491352 [Cokeromyces recurvatus]KAI7907574.1 hypothetical protein BX663DRAFT_491352 [Cokeromyces recurvatus]
MYNSSHKKPTKETNKNKSQYSSDQQEKKDRRPKTLAHREQFYHTFKAKLSQKIQEKESELNKERAKLKECEEQLKAACQQTEVQQLTLNRIQTQLYEISKPIKVTDDDLSTVTVHLAKLTGKIQHFPPSFKQAYLRKQQKEKLTPHQLKDIFCQWFGKDEKEFIEELFLEMIEQQKVDYGLISVLVERYLMDVIVNDIFKAGIHLDQGVNQAYNRLYHFFIQTGHPKWACDLRLKTARATYDLIHQGHPNTLRAIELSKQTILNSLILHLSFIYDCDTDQMKERVEKLVDMATHLCLPIHGQVDEIQIYDLNQKRRFTGELETVRENQVKHVYRYLNKDHIHLGIAPVFLAKSITEEEEDDHQSMDSYILNHTLIYPGKAIW